MPPAPRPASTGSPTTVSVTCHIGRARRRRRRCADGRDPPRTCPPSVLAGCSSPAAAARCRRGGRPRGRTPARAPERARGVERPSSPGSSVSVKVDQPAGHRVAVFVKEVHRIPGDEVPLDPGHPGRQQRQPAVDDRAHGAGVQPQPARGRSSRSASHSSRVGSRRGRRVRRTCRPASPASTSPAGVGRRPPRPGSPAAAAIRAASTLVAIPPVPTPAAAAPAEPDARQVRRRRAPRRSGGTPAGAGRRRRARRRRRAAPAGRRARGGRPARPAGRCRRTGSPRWRRCRSR